MSIKKLFVTTTICISVFTACNSNAQQTNLPVAEFEKEIGQSNIQILDVRTPEEYQFGHLKNAMLADWNNETVFKERVKSLDKNKAVYTYCLSGARSNAATRWLRQNGFTAYNLSGGIVAWKNSNKPLETAVSVQQITTEEYFAQMPTDKTVLVDFYAVWCPPCKAMSPIIDSIAKANSDRFTLVKIDGGTQTEICKTLKIQGFPTFIIYKQGKEVWRKEGLVDAIDFVKEF